jgi:hypothetical protein
MEKIIKLRSDLVLYGIPLFSRPAHLSLMKISGLTAPLILIALNVVRFQKGQPLRWEISTPATIIAVAALVFVVRENSISKKLAGSRVELQHSIVPAIYAFGLIFAGLILLARYVTQ